MGGEDLEGEDLEEFIYVTLPNQFWEGFSRLIAQVLLQAPPVWREDLLDKLQDMSSVFGSDYRHYLKELTKMPHDSRYIKTVEDFDRILANGAWAWPGGYPLYFICYDGEALSFQAAQKNVRLVREAVKDEDRSSGWYVVAYDINWEDMDLRCSHTNELIECAYPGDDPPPEYAEMIAKKYPPEAKK